MVSQLGFVVVENITCILYSSLPLLVTSYEPLEPLFLSPLIKDGRIDEAQKLANVEPFLPGVVSYSGYITVDEKLGSHMFFWFFTKTKNWTTAPLVLWLQGGPGFSSMEALFAQNGPYTYANGKLDHRQFSWTNEFNVVYVDNPVGTGFSFTESENGYSTNETDVGENLYETLRQFLLLFPQLQRNDLILTGVSYAGKYLTALGNAIARKQSTTEPPINVFGIFMGIPFISTEWMLPRFNEVLYSYGLIDAKERKMLREQEEKLLTLIHAKDWAEATMLYAGMYLKLHELTALPNLYNMTQDTADVSFYSQFLTLQTTKTALHVGNYTFDENTDRAKAALSLDMLQSFKPDFEQLLDHRYRVLVFSGQFDLVVPYQLNEFLFNHLSWHGAREYRRNDRYQCMWEETLVGYFKQADNFTHVLIRNAGHIAIADQPQRILGLLKKFAAGSFDSYIRRLDVSQ